MTAIAKPVSRGTRLRGWRPLLMRSLPFRIAIVLLCVLWSLPTFGLLVSSSTCSTPSGHWTTTPR